MQLEYLIFFRTINIGLYAYNSSIYTYTTRTNTTISLEYIP